RTRVEQACEMRRRLQEFKRMGRRRSVNDFELKSSRFMQVVELLQSRESLGPREFRGETLVKRILQNAPPGGGIGRKPLRHHVPRPFPVEPHRRQLERGSESTGREVAAGEAGGAAAEPLQAERVTQPASGIDRDQSRVQIPLCTGNPERRGHGGFPYSPGAKHDDDGALFKQVFHARGPCTATYQALCKPASSG